ncbi:sulfotransferase [Puniceicoccaceae bacterium K14]|nr:sulfotransferase [Puniceicoccaceae bacterium K14]
MKKTNLFLLGAPRSGTTQLASWLSQNENIDLLSVKEPNYFSSEDFPKEYVSKTKLNDVSPEEYCKGRVKRDVQFSVFREKEHYAYLLKGLSSRYRMDASTSYLKSKSALNRIYKYNDHSFFVVLLRDPIRRAVSHYQLARRTGRTSKALSELLHAKDEGVEEYLISGSQYSRHLEDYFEKFGRNRFLVLFFEDMIENPLGALREIEAFLELDCHNYMLEADKQNSSAMPRSMLFHRFIHGTGLKSFVLKFIGSGLESRIRNLYFNKSKKAEVTEADLECLRDLLASEYSEMLKSFPEVEQKWG